MKKPQRNESGRTLVLRKEVVRELSSLELAKAGGGYIYTGLYGRCSSADTGCCVEVP